VCVLRVAVRRVPHAALVPPGRQTTRGVYFRKPPTFG